VNFIKYFAIDQQNEIFTVAYWAGPALAENPMSTIWMKGQLSTDRINWMRPFLGEDDVGSGWMGAGLNYAARSEYPESTTRFHNTEAFEPVAGVQWSPSNGPGEYAQYRNFSAFLAGLKKDNAVKDSRNLLMPILLILQTFVNSPTNIWWYAYGLNKCVYYFGQTYLVGMTSDNDNIRNNPRIVLPRFNATVPTALYSWNETMVSQYDLYSRIPTEIRYTEGAFFAMMIGGDFKYVSGFKPPLDFILSGFYINEQLRKLSEAMLTVSMVLPTERYAYSERRDKAFELYGSSAISTFLKTELVDNAQVYLAMDGLDYKIRINTALLDYIDENEIDLGFTSHFYYRAPTYIDRQIAPQFLYMNTCREYNNLKVVSEKTLQYGRTSNEIVTIGLDPDVPIIRFDIHVPVIDGGIYNETTVKQTILELENATSFPYKINPYTLVYTWRDVNVEQRYINLPCVATYLIDQHYFRAVTADDLLGYIRVIQTRKNQKYDMEYKWYLATFVGAPFANRVLGFF
jgi:hypothetical protein